MGEFSIGQSVRRREDPRLLMGRGRYFDDLNLAHETIEIVLHTPHGQEATIAPDRKRHHSQHKETARYKHQCQPGCAHNLAHEAWLRHPRV